MIRHFLDVTGESSAEFARSYAVLGAQRALRIIGIFARLCLVSGKSGYLALLPRVWAQLQRNLAQPELAALAAVCTQLLPAPTPANLTLIGAKCGHFR
jgi:aminoglycoside/choline kinase family phosphotransferase